MEADSGFTRLHARPWDDGGKQETVLPTGGLFGKPYSGSGVKDCLEEVVSNQNLKEWIGKS